MFSSQQLRVGIASMTVFLVAVFTEAACASDRIAYWVGDSFTGKPCKGQTNLGTFGPFDYILNRDKLSIVEQFHFTPKVEQLMGGENNSSPIGDITYTFMKFPNHHRALYSAIRYALGESNFDQQSQYPMECVLQRAIAFSPRDPVPRMLYGLYLHKLDKLELSISRYREAERISPNNPMLAYNMGLVFYDAKQYESARIYAKKAYTAGVTLPGLKRKLAQAGQWP